MVIIAYPEVKYAGTDKWVYCGEYVHPHGESNFIMAPRIYESDYLDVHTISNFLRAYCLHSILAVSDEVANDITDNKFDTSTFNFMAASFDAISTSHSMFEAIKGGYLNEAAVELKDMVKVLYDLLMDRLYWKFEDEYRIVFIGADI